MRVKDRQKRANEAFTKPLTTHLTRDKGDFSCRGGSGRALIRRGRLFEGGAYSKGALIRRFTVLMENSEVR